MALRTKGKSAKKKEPEVIKPDAFDPTPLIITKFPNKATLTRKILPLWENFYRVNFHDRLNSNYVLLSHFIVIRDNKEVHEFA